MISVALGDDSLNVVPASEPGPYPRSFRVERCCWTPFALPLPPEVMGPGWRPGRRNSRAAYPSATTAGNCDLAAGLAQGYSFISRPPIKGREESGHARCTATSPFSIKSSRTVTTGHTGITRHSPRNGFNGLLRALAPAAAGFFSRSSTRSLTRLDTSVGVPGPHGFSVRFECPRLEAPSASTASRPASMTLRNAPLWWGGTEANIG